MKTIISNAKTRLIQAVEVAKCHFELGKAAYRYTFAERRFDKLHPVRNLREREVVGHKLAVIELEYALAANKLKSI